MTTPRSGGTAARLAPVIGRWRTEGRVLGPDPLPVVGSDVYEPGPGGHVLVHHVDVRVGPDRVRAIDDDGVWHFRGGSDIAPAARAGAEVPGAGAVRSTLRIAPDGRSMTALWERADDGVTWQPWMDMGFTRED
jgi:hypothetical protein